MKKLFTKLALAGAMLGLGPQYCTGRPLESRVCLSDQSWRSWLDICT